MDVLTEAIGRLRTGQAFACRVGTWGWRFPPNGAIGFHIIERGSGWVLTANNPPIPLSAGDVMLVPNGVENGLAARPASLHALPLAPMPPPHAPGGDFVALSGCYHVTGREVHRALRRLPDVTVASGGADDDERFRTAAWQRLSAGAGAEGAVPLRLGPGHPPRPRWHRQRRPCRDRVLVAVDAAPPRHR